jgi:chemotaxis methyl-accepting protein methylase
MISNDELDLILEHLRLTRCMDFGGYRPNTLLRRISVRLTKLNVRSTAAYLDILRSDPSEPDHHIDTIAVNVTSFFRDPLVFEIIARRVLPLLIASKRTGTCRETRTWSAGCATGEEAYSLAILFQESLKEESQTWRHLILATDIDSHALAIARKGLYPRSQLANVRLGQFDRYFTPSGSHFEVLREIREMVLFSKHDITRFNGSDLSGTLSGPFDLILCRNMLIYFKPDLQRRIMNILHKALSPGGYLVLGTAESLVPEVESKFGVVDKWAKIFQKRGRGREDDECGMMRR